MSKKCYLCKSSEDNELLFGKFYSKWKLTVHYYCLLLSSNLVQRGSNDTVGIFGFLESDIRKENERTKKCRCYICKDMHANVFCCSKKCLRTFHTACGIMNGCLSHYTDTYQSWCSAHVPLDPDTAPHTSEEPCSICYDEMGQYDVITSIKAPCCRNGWFHQGCVAQYAQSAGYFFKCPLCNNEDKFLAEIPLRGVFVPERDAAWELEPNAFQEQLLRPTACDAAVCKCREGRSVDNRQWRLVVCGSCGSTCRHRQCMEQPVKDSRAYLCQLCRPILAGRMSVLENPDDSDDSSEDDTSTSSDEPLCNYRQLATARKALLDGSDSERSDGSSVEIRRSIRQNTGKRVRRLMSEESENETSSRTGRTPIPSPSGDEDDERDGNSSSSSGISKAEVRSTRQLRRRLSALSDSSKGSTSASNTEERESQRSSTRRPRIDSSSDQRDKKPISLNQTRRPRISTSSDDFEKRSEDGSHSSDASVDVASHKECYTTLQRDKEPKSSNQTRRPRISSSSDDCEKRTESETSKSSALDDRSNTIASKRWDETSNMTATDRSPPASVKGMHANASDTSLESDNTAAKSVRQLAGRHSPNEAGKRTTSESSTETIRPKRMRAARSAALFDDSDKRTEDSENGTTDKLDSAPQTKRRRITRERCNKTNQSSTGTQRHKTPSISPPSTPPSLASESSQQSVATNGSGGKAGCIEGGKKTGSGTPPNLQQKSMLQFFTFSARKTAATSDSSDQSMEETGSPWARFGGSNNINSKISPISKKRVRATKRRRTNSPKKFNNRSHDGQQPESGPTSSRTASVQQRTSKGPFVCKDKGQKNLLNYFNRY